MIKVIVRGGMVVVGTRRVIASSVDFSLRHSWIVPVPQVDCLIAGTRVTPG